MANYIIHVNLGATTVTPTCTDVHRSDTVQFKVDDASSAQVTFPNGNPFTTASPFTIPATPTVSANAADGTYNFEVGPGIALNGMIKVGSNV